MTAQPTGEWRHEVLSSLLSRAHRRPPRRHGPQDSQAAPGPSLPGAVCRGAAFGETRSDLFLLWPVTPTAQQRLAEFLKIHGWLYVGTTPGNPNRHASAKAPFSVEITVTAKRGGVQREFPRPWNRTWDLCIPGSPVGGGKPFLCGAQAAAGRTSASVKGLVPGRG